jgi:hypothetical protein
MIFPLQPGVDVNKENAPVQDGKSVKPKKSKVCFSSLCMLLVQLLRKQAPRASDILPGNVAKNENIKLLRVRWECNLTTCSSEHCYTSSEGSHFPLNHDRFEKWAAAMVRCHHFRFATERY